jgi:hypothetical protein
MGRGVLDRWIAQKQTFDVVDFADDVGVLSHVHVHLGLIDCGDVTLRAAVTDGKRENIEGTELSNLVSRVDNHLGLLDERQA